MADELIAEELVVEVLMADDDIIIGASVANDFGRVKPVRERARMDQTPLSS